MLTRRQQVRRMRAVAGCALAIYNIKPVSLSLLSHFYNTTFTVTGPDGARYVLHILRPEDDPIAETQRVVRVRSELWWLDRLRADLGLAVPAFLRTPGGDDVVSVPAEGRTRPLLCTLSCWIDGRFLDRGLLPGHLEQVGRLTARLHDHSTALTVPPWFNRPRVAIADAATEERVVQFFGDFLSREAAAVMQRAFTRIRRAQGALGTSSDTYGLIHADIHQKNYLFDHGAIRLIDFGDSGWGHYLYDFAVTLSELEGRANYPQLRAALLAGYREVRTLTLEHEALIDDFIMLREVENLTWFLEERDNPTYTRWTAQLESRVARLERLLAGGALS